jgi:hypothetical protein
MKRTSSLAATFLASIVAVMLVTAGCGGTPLQTAAAKSTASGGAANPCAVKAQPCAANPCAPQKR